jgi:ABC-type oligopeptide transport system substrate-binding subunit
MKYNKKPIVTALAVVCVVSLLALASCAPKANSGQAVSSSSASAQSDLPIYTADGQLNDERCLSCHGGKL